MVARDHIPAAVVRRVWAAAGGRCGYCLAPQELVLATLQIDHILPVTVGGTGDESNLWLACPVCNGHKSGKVEGIDPETGETVRLYNPRTQVWGEHFCWSPDGAMVIGLTPTGRATVVALHLATDSNATKLRARWAAAGWHPPTG